MNPVSAWAGLGWVGLGWTKKEHPLIEYRLLKLVNNLIEDAPRKITGLYPSIGWHKP